MYSVYTIQCILVYAETGSCLAIPATIVSRLAIPPKLLPIWLSLPNFFFFNSFLNMFFWVLAFIGTTIFNLQGTVFVALLSAAVAVAAGCLSYLAAPLPLYCCCCSAAAAVNCQAAAPSAAGCS